MSVAVAEGFARSKEWSYGGGNDSELGGMKRCAGLKRFIRHYKV